MGRFDLIAQVKASDMTDLSRPITDEIRSVMEVFTTESLIVGF